MIMRLFFDFHPRILCFFVLRRINSYDIVLKLELSDHSKQNHFLLSSVISYVEEKLEVRKKVVELSRGGIALNGYNCTYYDIL